MPDITMCKGELCKARKHCYRFTATPSEYRQSWFMNPPGSDKKCEYYSEMEYNTMKYNVIDAETGEIYISDKTAVEASQFMTDYQCRIVPCPDFVPAAARDDSDYYVVPTIEVS